MIPAPFNPRPHAARITAPSCKIEAWLNIGHAHVNLLPESNDLNAYKLASEA